MLFGNKVRLCLRTDIHPNSSSKQTTDTCRQSAVRRSIRIENLSNLPLHFIIRRMCQNHRFGSRYALMYLQQLLTGNEKDIYYRSIRCKLRKERLISRQALLSHAY